MKNEIIIYFRWFRIPDPWPHAILHTILVELFFSQRTISRLYFFVWSNEIIVNDVI